VFDRRALAACVRSAFSQAPRCVLELVDDRPLGSVSGGARSLTVAAPIAAVLLSFSILAASASGQTTRPTQKVEDEKLYKAASEAPVLKIVLRTADGKDLSEAQKKDIERSRSLMTVAEAALAQGRFEEAVTKSTEALHLRQPILPPKHHLIGTSRVLAAEYSRWVTLPADEQRKLAEALKQVAAAAESHEQGDSGAAMAAAASALAAFEAILPRDHAATSEALLQLGKAQLDRSLLAEAKGSLGRALSISERIYGKNHPNTARVLDRLGWLGIRLAHAGGYDTKIMEAAASSMRRAQGIFEATYGEGRESAEVLDNLGTALLYLRSPDRALDAKLRSLYVRKQVLGPDDTDTGVSFSNLAWLYGELGDKGRVIPLRRRALAIFNKQLAAHHTYRIMEMSNLAEALQYTGEATEAIEIWKSLGELDKQRGIEGTLDAIGRCVKLGAAHIAAGHTAESVQVFADAFGLIQKLHAKGEREPAIAALERLSEALRQKRMYADGLAYQEQLVAWTNAARGKQDNLPAVRRMIRLGLAYSQLGRLENAKRALSQGVARIDALRGKGSIEATSPMLNLSSVLERLGELDAAEAVCEQVVQTVERKLGRGAPSAAYALMQMGRLSRLRKRLEIAEFSLGEAKAVFDGLVRQDRNGNVRILHEMAYLSALRGDRKKAEQQLRSALAICRQASPTGSAPQLDGLIAKTLHRLLDATDAADSAVKNDRQAWRAELTKLLKSLEARRALIGAEKGWLAEMQ